MFRHIDRHWGIFRYYWGILCHIASDIFRTLCNPCIYNGATFRTLTHIEPEASSYACWTCKMTRCVQSLGIVRTLYKHFQGYFGVFRGIDTYSSTLTGMKLGGWRGAGLPCPFLKIEKKCSDFGEKALIVPIFGLNFPFKM